jgi:excisionase family DNA binding protein
VKTSELDDLLFGKFGDRQSLSPLEVAKALGVSLKTIYRWVEEDKFTTTALGNGTLRIIRRSVVAFYQAGLAVGKAGLIKGPAPAAAPTDKPKPARKTGSGWIRRY